MPPDSTQTWHHGLVATRWVDTHSHLDRFEPAERAHLLERAAESGVAVVAVGGDSDLSRAALEIAGAAGGVHPVHAAVADLHALTSLVSDPRAVAVGECGFDTAGPPARVQAAVFSAQARIARALRLPLILHINGEGAFSTVERHSRDIEELTVVRHYFTGDDAEAAWHAERGHFLSFGNPLRREAALQEIARSYPQQLLLIETDSYPLPGRHTAPHDVVLVAEALALTRGWDAEETSRQLLANTRKAFPRLVLS